MLEAMTGIRFKGKAAIYPLKFIFKFGMDADIERRGWGLLYYPLFGPFKSVSEYRRVAGTRSAKPCHNIF